MGTGYKGNALYYHDVSENISNVTVTYPCQNGRFGINSPHTGNDTRNIFSEDNLAAARDFYNRLAFGGLEEEINSNTRVTRMADGTVITFRITSHSDGTPAVSINVDRSSQPGILKTHKIHFVKEGS